MMYIRVYTSSVTKEYSIADARRNLPDLVNAVEAGAKMRLTRRGRPITIVVSVNDYERLTQKRTSFAEAFAEFRKRFPNRAGKPGPSYWVSLRNRGSGRKV